MSSRNVREEPDGRPGIDASYQHFSERPFGGPGETVDATPDAEGEITTEGVPVPSDSEDRPDGEGQTTFDDWGWSR